VPPVQIRLSNVDEMFARGQELFAEHWEEVALNKSVMALSPDEGQYRNLEASGMLIALGAFEDDGELIGYSVGYVVTHPHYSRLRIYQNDILFVTKAKRRSKLGLQLIRETERMAASKGARMVLWHAKQGTALEHVLPRLGYGVQDIIYSREV
jgi:predicted GNAT superfamily acetyltransferase